jgi:hypothetical protein
VEEIQVLTNTEVTVCLAVVMTAANLYWSYLNWRTYQGQKKIMSAALLSAAEIKAQAPDFLSAAEAKAAQLAIEQQCKVCSVSHRIASKHTTGEQGVTVCAGCVSLHQNANVGGVTTHSLRLKE